MAFWNFEIFMPAIVILSATRTPVGAFQGALASVPASRLGAAAIRGAVASAGINPADVKIGRASCRERV